jgi:hypothetical protein
VVLDVGDGGAGVELNQALTMNHIDMYFGQPWASPEEELYPVVSSALRAWAREHLPRYEKAAEGFAARESGSVPDAVASRCEALDRAVSLGPPS